MTANTINQYIVAVNAGSSSIKLAAFLRGTMQKVFEAAVENIGQPSARLVTVEGIRTADARDHFDATTIVIDQLTRQHAGSAISAVGHRIVHGGPKYRSPQLITRQVLADLRELTPFDPQHLHIELELVRIFQKLLPETEQVLCFDTSFHADLPTRARLLPIPRHLAAKGLVRYGFHGLSYTFIMEELRRVEGEVAANGKIIIAHLGSGASLVAVRDGKSVDTTMSLTPASGVPMSTRSGDLDPGLMLYLAQTQGYSAERLSHMVNFESGLLGISETTADMKKLLEVEAQDERAKDAIAVFCYQVKKSIGSLAAALGGLDTIVFTGGMGENAPKIRARICEGLEFLGVTIDVARNQGGVRLISADCGRVGVHVIHTDEATTVARETVQLITNKEQEGNNEPS